jgi:hypothetical protein
VQDLTVALLDDEEAVEQPERHRRHREEVEGDGDFTMVLENCPPLTRIATASRSPQMSSR